MQVFEELVRLQEDEAVHDTLATDASRRLKALRERFFLNATPAPGPEVLDSAAHRDLVMLVRARGGA